MKGIIRFIRYILAYWNKKPAVQYVETRKNIVTLYNKKIISFDMIESYRGDMNDLVDRFINDMTIEMAHKMVKDRLIEVINENDHQHGHSKITVKLLIVQP